MCGCTWGAPQCDVVAKQLEHAGYRVTMLHGGKAQDQREESIKVRMVECICTDMSHPPTTYIF